MIEVNPSWKNLCQNKLAFSEALKLSKKVSRVLETFNGFCAFGFGFCGFSFAKIV